MPTRRSPNTSTAPRLGSSSPAATLSSVLLPQPVGPTTLTNSPAPTARPTFSTAVYRCSGASAPTNAQVIPRSRIAGPAAAPGASPTPPLSSRAPPSAIRIGGVGFARKLVREDRLEVDAGRADLWIDARQGAQRRLRALRREDAVRRQGLPGRQEPVDVGGAVA